MHLQEFKIPNLSKGLNRRRFAMPQIQSKDLDEFLRWLETKHGISNTRKTVDPKKLIPSQKEFNQDKIQKIVDNPSVLKKAIVSTKNDVILDGHHRWAAAAVLDQKIDSFIIDAEFDDVVELMKKFPKSFTKKLSESRIMSFGEFIAEERK